MSWTKKKMNPCLRMKEEVGQSFPAAEPAAEAALEPAPTLSGPKDDRFYHYWDLFTSRPKYPRVTLAPSLDADEEGEPSHRPASNKEGIITSQKASTSYEEARDACKSKVRAIVEECRRLNLKYLDRSFDLEEPDALKSLEAKADPLSMHGLCGSKAVKRVEDIFENPQFYEDGATANDICQGGIGDCWFLAAIAALSGKPELLERVCVDRDENVGVYGFVFYRDGEWVSEVVDDMLCLKHSDDGSLHTTEYLLTTDGQKSLKGLSTGGLEYGKFYVSKLPKEYHEQYRKGSKALFFASCRSKNETWLPLLEKAYAKAHGDYQSIEGGFPGEGVEDLTGGVATYLFSEHVLDKDKLWAELKQVNQGFLFGCGSRNGRDSEPQDDEGFVRGHAYTVLEAREVGDLKLLKIRNPWGDTEWNGAWSDGSKEWTAEMMQKLNHTFGDDGIFWISYADFLKYYPEIDRTRLFSDEWTVTQQWTSVEVPWTADYLSTKFSLSLKEASPVVLVLSQPDDRYFKGLEGRYSYELHFRLYKNGQKTYLARSIQDSGSGRSCTAELDLDAGAYTIYVKLLAQRTDEGLAPAETIFRNRETRREKLHAVGKSYDIVHAKGRLREMERNKARRDQREVKRATKKENVAERVREKKKRERERMRLERIRKETERKLVAKKAHKRAKKEIDKEATAAAKRVAEKSEKSETKECAPTEEQIPAPPPPEAAKQSAESTGSLSAPTEKTAASASETKALPSQNSPLHSAGAAGGQKIDEKPEASSVRVDITVKSDNKDTEVSVQKGEIGVEVAAEEEEDDDDVSVSSASDVNDNDFDWDSDIDGSLPSDSEDDEPQGDDLYKDKPWNAVCVIGLKVCYMGADAEIKVIHDEQE